jgi:lactate racemase
MDKFKYGQSLISLYPGRKEQIDYLKKISSSMDNPENIVRAALKESIPSLLSLIKPGFSIALIVSDYTRPTGSNIYIPILLNELSKIGSVKITIIIALGLHRPATKSEIETICGSNLPKGIRIINHHAESNLASAGEAAFNKEAVDSDIIITTGAVTFHPMVGYSGGRKSLLPGIASSKDIYQNHKLYFDAGSVHTGIGPANIDNNPVLNDIRTRTQGLKRIWALNVVLNEQNLIEFASCGEIDHVWDKCRQYVLTHHSICIKEKYDLVISSSGGYPSDHSFYQSMKVLTNSSLACKSGGTLIIISQCIHGWEIRDELFSYFTMSLEEIAENLENSFTMDGLALYMALSIIRSYDVWLYSELPEKEVTAAGMGYIKDLNNLPNITNQKGEQSDIRIAVMHNGSSVLPVCKDKLRNNL